MGKLVILRVILRLVLRPGINTKSVYNEYLVKATVILTPYITNAFLAFPLYHGTSLNRILINLIL